jgi:hypothetical protein
MNKEQLYETILSWEEDGRRDARDSYPYMSVLRDIDFHDSTRFHQYQQFSNQDGPFSTRLLNWMDNVSHDPERKALLKLLSQVSFIDTAQMHCLYRDAFRRIIVPWLLGSESIEDRMSVDRPQLICEQVSRTSILSITDSMKVSDFCQVNDLPAPKPIVLGEDEVIAQEILRMAHLSKTILVLEDFVGSGRQARKILNISSDLSNGLSRILFVPMIILNSGADSYISDPIPRVTVKAVHVIPGDECVSREMQPGERDEHQAIRAIVLATEDRVLQPSGDTDDPPRNAFGYSSSGSLVVTAHNVPNNTLPLIHHQNAAWRALFRRLHHPRSDGRRKGGKL